jgi:uncharacterized protein
MARHKKKPRPSKYQEKYRLMVDSSALMALFDVDDYYHKEAVRFRDSFILNYEVELFTTNYIYSETMSHLTHLSEPVLRKLDLAIRSPSPNDPLVIKQLWVDDKIIQEAIPIYFKYLELDFSITDCTSFILMQKNGIFAAFSFDKDYKIYTYKKGYEKQSFWKLPEMLDGYIRNPIRVIT